MRRMKRIKIIEVKPKVISPSALIDLVLDEFSAWNDSERIKDFTLRFTRPEDYREFTAGRDSSINFAEYSYSKITAILLRERVECGDVVVKPTPNDVAYYIKQKAR